MSKPETQNPKCIGILPEPPNVLHAVCDCGRVYEGHRDEWEYLGTDPNGSVHYSAMCAACGDAVFATPGKLPKTEREKLLPVADGK